MRILNDDLFIKRKMAIKTKLAQFEKVIFPWKQPTAIKHAG